MSLRFLQSVGPGELRTPKEGTDQTVPSFFVSYGITDQLSVYTSIALYSVRNAEWASL